MLKYGIVAIALAALCGNAVADETLKVKTFSHLVSVNSQDVGDVPGHTLALIRTQGLVSFPDGSVGTSYWTVVTNYTNGSGPIPIDIGNITASDGSMLWFDFPGEGITQGGKTSVKGTLRVTGGTGKFAGMKGEGTWTGQRLQPSLAPGAEIYNEMTINLHK
jgi:hypothetical protein